MNKNLVLLTVMTMLLFPQETQESEPPVNLPVFNIAEMEREKKLNQLHEFMEAIGMLESNNTYDVENRFGMLGKYQFAPTTIEYLGFEVTREEFLSNPDLQDEVMLAYLEANYQTLYDYIMEYDGKEFKGITLNTASILAGAHFAGATGLKRFIDNMAGSVGVTDGNGMTLKRYMRQFSHYEIDLDV